MIFKRRKSFQKNSKWLRIAEVYSRKSGTKLKKFKIEVEQPSNKLKNLTSNLKVLKSKMVSM